MTLKEMKQIRKKIKRINDRISTLEGMATNTSVQLSFAPKAGDHHDKIGEYAARIADLKTELKGLETKYQSELNRLSIDDDTANCVWLFLHGYSWERIANIGSSHMEKADLLRVRARSYKW